MFKSIEVHIYKNFGLIILFLAQRFNLIKVINQIIPLNWSATCGKDFIKILGNSSTRAEATAEAGMKEGTNLKLSQSCSQQIL